MDGTASTSNKLRYAEAAKRLGVAPGTLRAWVARGTAPPHVRLSPRLVVFDAAELDEWVAAHRVPAAADSLCRKGAA
jgi:excisionase family DNA binding protein